MNGYGERKDQVIVPGQVPHTVFATEEIYFIHDTKRSEQGPPYDDHDKKPETGSGSFRRRKKIPVSKEKIPDKRIFRTAPGLEDRYPGTQRRVAKLTPALFFC